VADVDPDDGPLDEPPTVLVVGRLYVITLFVIDSSMFTVTAASSSVLIDDADLHKIEVAAIHVVDSHLIICVIYIT
jgi:hypothetical protein